MKIVTSDQVRKLRELYPHAGMHDYKTALEVREGNLELAVEWLQRHNLAIVTSDKNRFPKWHAYLEANGRTE